MKYINFLILIMLGFSFICESASSGERTLGEFERSSLGLDVDSYEYLVDLTHQYGDLAKVGRVVRDIAVNGKKDIYSNEMYETIGGYLLSLEISVVDEENLLVLKYLMSHGVDPFKKDAAGAIPIFKAVFYSNPRSLKFILNYSDYRIDHKDYLEKLRDYALIDKKHESYLLLNEYIE